jgi:DNA mismatch endonuclease (patch repair protein)
MKGASVDTLTPDERSQRMRLVRSKDTKPEIFVRRLVHALGYRYRLHGSVLPGKPDLVFPSSRKAIFVHGCFWHGHRCRLGRVPKSGLEYWAKKIRTNRERDRSSLRRLRRLEWKCLVLWECGLRKDRHLAEKIKRFLDS